MIMKSNETFSAFLMNVRKLGNSSVIPISSALLIWAFSSLMTVSGQAGESGQEKPVSIPLAQRIGILINRKPLKVRMSIRVQGHYSFRLCWDEGQSPG